MSKRTRYDEWCEVWAKKQAAKADLGSAESALIELTDGMPFIEGASDTISTEFANGTFRIVHYDIHYEVSMPVSEACRLRDWLVYFFGSANPWEENENCNT